MVTDNNSWFIFVNHLMWLLADAEVSSGVDYKGVNEEEIISFSIKISAPNNPNGSVQDRWEKQIPYPMWQIGLKSGNLRPICVEFHDLPQRTPNISCGLVGFSWKNGNLV